ncbi:DUF7706 family protein [Undibacterium sp. TC4M20W]|uniref:DUF7706 family protein n=1 Tax=Undibacterium sp. TC4M20W TaxID=3413052 RepID=UPI003BEF4E84
MRIVKITSYMSADQAQALAQFFKRVGFSEFKQLAATIDEAYLMQEGALKVADGLADNGFAPR